MDFENMTLEEILARIAEIDIEVRNQQDAAQVQALTEELEGLKARKRELEDIQKRQKVAQQINSGTVQGNILEMRSQTQAMPRVRSLAEIRSSREYGEAFVHAIMDKDATEARALLGTNAPSDGTIPVPEMLDTEIRNAWEESQIMTLVKRTGYSGNLKVGFEYSASAAAIHLEGAEAPAEGTLELGIVEIKAQSIIKWITISREAIDGTTIDTLAYVYKEIAQKIVEKAEEILIGQITAAPATSTKSAPAVATVTMNPAVDTVVKAVAQLSSRAKTLNIAMNRQTYAEFVSIALNANYSIDVFDGLKDKVVYTDKLKAFSAASTGDPYMIIGDFGYGAQANFPNGNDIGLILDRASLAEKGLVKVVGDQYVGTAVVAPKAFVTIKKAETA